MFEPIIFSIAISLFSFIAAVTLVTSSRRLVPINTIVSPIIISDMWNFFAIPLAPSTNKSAPTINSISYNIQPTL